MLTMLFRYLRAFLSKKISLLLVLVSHQPYNVARWKGAGHMRAARSYTVNMEYKTVFN